MMPPIQTRVGLILEHDNRFCGRSAYSEWSREARSPTDLWATAFGIDVDDYARDTLRLLAVCLTSPDARVWPLKLTRLLSSHGDPTVGFFAAQLVTSGRTMGPGTLAGAAALLATWVELDDDGRAALLMPARTQRQRLAGFGVPFRAADERMVALKAAIDDTPARNGRHWQAMTAIVQAVATFADVQPNISIGSAAVLLDLGVPPERCGLGLTLLMSHVFLGHAVEAASTDAALQTLPAAAVRYVGPPPRRS